MARSKKIGSPVWVDEKENEDEGPASALPEKITLRAPHGFIDEDGNNNHWHNGVEITDPDHIKLLISRGAVWE